METYYWRADIKKGNGYTAVREGYATGPALPIALRNARWSLLQAWPEYPKGVLRVWHQALSLAQCLWEPI